MSFVRLSTCPLSVSWCPSSVDIFLSFSQVAQLGFLYWHPDSAAGFLESEWKVVECGILAETPLWLSMQTKTRRFDIYISLDIQTYGSKSTPHTHTYHIPTHTHTHVFGEPIHRWPYKNMHMAMAVTAQSVVFMPLPNVFKFLSDVCIAIYTYVIYIPFNKSFITFQAKERARFCP